MGSWLGAATAHNERAASGLRVLGDVRADGALPGRPGEREGPGVGAAGRLKSEPDDDAPHGANGKEPEKPRGVFDARPGIVLDVGAAERRDGAHQNGSSSGWRGSETGCGVRSASHARASATTCS